MVTLYSEEGVLLVTVVWNETKINESLFFAHAAQTW